MDAPILRLELERMSIALQTAILSQNDAIAAEVQRQADEYCTEAHFQHLVREQTRRAIDSATSKMVQRYFEYGAGADAIKTAVGSAMTDVLYPERMEDEDDAPTAQ